MSTSSPAHLYAVKRTPETSPLSYEVICLITGSTIATALHPQRSLSARAMAQRFAAALQAIQLHGTIELENLARSIELVTERLPPWRPAELHELHIAKGDRP